jgi:hypothetical protein
LQGSAHGGAQIELLNQNRAVAREGIAVENFKSRQFAEKSSNKSPAKLPSHSRKMYPELASFIDMQIKQEQLLKLERENHSNLAFGRPSP